jgi:DNA-binding MarR family transcriptional regulator
MTDPKAYRTEREWQAVDHPDHYGGKENLYEAIKIIEAYDLNFSLGNVIKYVLRAGKKNSDVIEDLKKAKWYIDRQIKSLEKK